jgi:preprotein translocase subunit SecE
MAGIIYGRKSGVNLIQKPVNFLKEVKAELGKVAWSTRQELIGSTVVVIVTTAIMAVFIGLIDIILSRFLSAVFK